MAGKKKSEQRINRRISAEMSMRYGVIDGTGESSKQQKVTTTNISSSGVAFVTTDSIALDARMNLRIFLPGRKGSLECEAVVSRIVNELADGQGIEYGVNFDTSTVKDPSKLSDFIRSIDIVPLLEQMTKIGASDLHIIADGVPMFRNHMRLEPAIKKPLPADMVEQMIMGTLSIERRRKFAEKKELYFPFMVPGIGRWRACVFLQRGQVEATFHALSDTVPSITGLDLPDVLHGFALAEGGLVAVTGASKSGKSTTMAALVDHINTHKEKVIITLEDPVQYTQSNKRSIIKQREVGTDTHSIFDGLEHIMRQDVNVIVTDEIHSAEEMELLLRAAETGHLVITAFPTQTAEDTIRYILSLFPADRRASVLHSLSNILRGVISQRIVPSADGTAAVMVPEVLTMNDSVRQAIWTNKLDQLPNLMLSSPGSITVDLALRNLIVRGQVSMDTAMQIARDPEGLRRSVAI